jgi:hypothetical protein
MFISGADVVGTYAKKILFSRSPETKINFNKRSLSTDVPFGPPKINDSHDLDIVLFCESALFVLSFQNANLLFQN